MKPSSYERKYRKGNNETDWNSLLDASKEWKALNAVKRSAIRYLVGIFGKELSEVKSLAEVVLKVYSDRAFMTEASKIAREFNSLMNISDIESLRGLLAQFLEGSKGNEVADDMVKILDKYEPKVIIKVANLEKALHKMFLDYVNKRNDLGNFSKLLKKSERILKQFGFNFPDGPRNGIEASLGEYYDFEPDEDGNFTRVFKDRSGNECCLTYHSSNNFFSISCGDKMNPVFYAEIDATGLDLSKCFKDIDDGEVRFFHR